MQFAKWCFAKWSKSIRVPGPVLSHQPPHTTTPILMTACGRLGTRAQNVSWQHGGWVGHEDHNFSPLKIQSGPAIPCDSIAPTPYNVGLVSPFTTVLREMGPVHAPAEMSGSKSSRLAFTAGKTTMSRWSVIWSATRGDLWPGGG